MSAPAIPTKGLRHVALNVADVATSVAFYTELFGMRVVWQPDAENAYLSSGCDNLALHRASPEPPSQAAGQRLAHLGFVVADPSDVDRAAEMLSARQVPIVAAPRTHRDGSRSLYCQDPDGSLIQVLYEPRLSPQQLG